MARNNAATNELVVAQVLEVEGTLKGKTFSITGHLGLKRDDVVKIIRQAGGQFEERPRWDGYGRTKNFLITNGDFNANSTITPKKSSKMIQAEQNGWKIINEKDFLQMLTNSN